MTSRLDADPTRDGRVAPAHEDAQQDGAPVADAIFDRATVRRAEFDLDYAGAVTPQEAWALVRSRAALLVDVRTAPEFKFVGRVPSAINVEWHGNDAAPRARFIEGLRRASPPAQPVLLLCRSGVRSHAAAAAAAGAGYARVYNVLEGFEGQIDGASQRGKLNGWRYHGLPWVQD